MPSGQQEGDEEEEKENEREQVADLKREVRQSLHNTNSHTQTGIEHEWTCCQGDKKKQRPRPPPSCFTQ